jgi:hypothetical protein
VQARLAQLPAITMIGEGFLAVLVPRKHTLLWAGGPTPWWKTMRGFARNPLLTRIAGGIEFTAGVWRGVRLAARGK